MLRVAAVLRRTMPAQATDTILSCGPITMDQARHLRKLDDEPVEPPRPSSGCSRSLMLRAGYVVSKETLLRAVWDIDFDSASTVVDTYISYLRKKPAPRRLRRHQDHPRGGLHPGAVVKPCRHG